MIIGDRVTLAAPDVAREGIRFGLRSSFGIHSHDVTQLYNQYVVLTNEYLEEIWKAYRGQFNAAYRRSFTSADFQFISEPRIGAFTQARTGPQNIYLRSGNLLAVEDAALAVLSHPKYDFVARQDCARDPHSGVRRLPAYELFDKWRYVDYSFVHALVNAREFDNPSVIATVLAKFVPGSIARCSLSSFIAQIALQWIISHENAHYYLGHLTEFGTWGGAAGGVPFDELVALGSTEEEFAIRCSAEISADDAATHRMMDHFFDFDVFELGVIPEKYLHTDFLIGELAETQEDLRIYLSAVEAWQQGHEQCDLPGMAKRIFLVRATCLAIFIALCCFERQTRKANAYTRGYPAFGIRMLNIITEVLNCTMGMRMSRGWQVGGRACLLGEAALLGILLVRDLRNVMRETLLCGDVMHDRDMADNTHESLLGGGQEVLLTSIFSFLTVGSMGATMETFREFAEDLETKTGNTQPNRPAEIVQELEGTVNLSAIVTEDELFWDFARCKKLSCEHARNVFWDARRIINKHISYKVDEDRRNIDLWKRNFERLLTHRNQH